MPEYKNGKLLLLFIGFLIIYLLPGIYGHTPWKQDENYSFGIIQTMYDTGNWLVPINAGEPFMEKPPLYYWVATITASLFSGVMPLHDAARTATLFFSVVNFCFFVLLARRVFNSDSFSDSRIWIAFAIYISAPGLLRHSHDMFTDVALTAGATIGLYGIVGLILRQKVVMSAVWLCIGTTVTMLSKGVFVPGLLWITLLLSPLFLSQCRDKSFWYPVLLAGIGAFILILPWPVMLYLQHPDLFMVWFWENNIGRFLGFSVAKLGAKAAVSRIPEAIALFALPAGIMAALYFIRHPLKRLRNPTEFSMVLFPLLGLVMLQTSATSRALYLLPFIAPLAILSTRLLLVIKPRVLRYFTHFAVALWSLVILLVWALYLLKLNDPQNSWLAQYDHWLPANYSLHLALVPFGSALIMTLLWCCRSRIIAKASPALQAAFSWGLGITVSWGVIFTLLVGWIDYTKGYQEVFDELKTELAGHYQPGDCMASYRIDESEAPMLYYFTGILPHRQQTFSKPESCHWFIVRSDSLQTPPEGMTLFWSGNRPGEKRNIMAVYKDASR